MLTSGIVLLLAVAALAANHEKDSSDVAVHNSEEALAEANRLIAAAKQLKSQGLLQVDNSLIGSGNIAIVQGGKKASSSSLSDSSDSSSSSDDKSAKTELSTSDRLHIAVEERLIEAAILDALKTQTTPSVNKKAFQARYEITAFDGNAFKTEELNFGPTLISTRRNFFLTNSDQGQWWTMGDFLDADQNGEPDMIAALKTFKSTNNPTTYLTILRNRASGSRARLDSRASTGGLTSATIDLINLIRLDGRFSLTNQLLSPCFSATDEEEFVFETLVGLAQSELSGDARLSAIPEQTTASLLAGSTALSADGLSFGTDKNLFYDATSDRFVSTLTIPLWLNLVPDQLIPGEDNVQQQGNVHFAECSQFSYFN